MSQERGSLQEEAKKLVAGGHDGDLLLPPYGRIREAFRLMIRNLEAGWDDRRNKISDVDLRTIEITASLVPKSEEVIEQSELDKIEEGVEELTSVILDSNLDEEFRLLILKHLQEIRNAVHEYKIRGAVRLFEAGSSGLGIVIIVANHISESEKQGKEIHPKAKEAVSKLGQLATWVVQLGTFAWKNRKMLLEAVKRLPLLLGSSDIDLPELGPGEIDVPDVGSEDITPPE